MWEWLNTVSLLKSEITKDIIKPKKLNITKKNCKNVIEIILLLKVSRLLKFLIERNKIKNEQQSPKTKE